MLGLALPHTCDLLASIIDIVLYPTAAFPLDTSSLDVYSSHRNLFPGDIHGRVSMTTVSTILKASFSGGHL